MQELTQLPPDSAGEVTVTDSAAPAEPDEGDLELEELLIREITIDGMCGVY